MEHNPRGKKQGNQQDQFDKILHKKCSMHPKGNHSLFDCIIICKFLNAPIPEGVRKKSNNEDEDDDKQGSEGWYQ